MNTLLVFSHNDESTIAGFLKQLLACLQRCGLSSTRIYILANGCKDRTAENARASLSGMPPETNGRVVEIELGGKANAWNTGIHEVLKDGDDSDLVAFLDSDIELSETRIDQLFSYLESNPRVSATTSRPVKRKVSLTPSTLVSYVLSRSNPAHRDGAICGQLYAARLGSIRRIKMPRGLLVEDGFLAACLRTDMFSIEPDDELIKAHPDVLHFFDVEGTLAGAVKHEARTELGSLMNFEAFDQLWAVKGKEGAEKFLQRRYSEDPDWLIEDYEKSFKAKDSKAFEWSRALLPFRNLKGGLGFPASLVFASLRSAQRGLALRKAYKMASNSEFRW